MINPAGDNDYYKFVITTAGTATVTLSALPADYDLRIYKSNGTSQVASSSNAGTTSEVITRSYTAGTYYARVFGYNNANNATSCYNLRIDLGTAARGVNEMLITSSGRLSVSPNPVSTNANIVFTAAGNGTATIIVTNQTGAVVLKQTSAAVKGDNIKQLDVTGLSNGVYFVRVSTGDKVEVAKIVVVK